MTITNYGTLAEQIRKEVYYNPETGFLTWRSDGRGKFKRAGASVGCLRPDGYYSARVNAKQWLVHRLVWVYVYGEEPPKIIDHINRNKGDNRIENLRSGVGGVNELNSKVHKRSPFGISGVRRGSKPGNYQAYVAIRGNFQSFYHGPDFFEACCARKSWEARYWGASQ